jgi:hypothetical protein
MVAFVPVLQGETRRNSSAITNTKICRVLVIAHRRQRRQWAIFEHMTNFLRVYENYTTICACQATRGDNAHGNIGKIFIILALLLLKNKLLLSQNKVSQYLTIRSFGN